MLQFCREGRCERDPGPGFLPRGTSDSLITHSLNKSLYHSITQSIRFLFLSRSIQPGILAADESTGTIGKRFAPIGVENNEDNRRKYRQILFSTPNLGDHISGAILFEETLFSKIDGTGPPLTSLLAKAGVVVGIKVDKVSFLTP